MSAAVNVLDTLATENAVSGVTAPPVATSARPLVPRQIEPSAKRIAAETPGMPVLRPAAVSSAGIERRAQVGRRPGSGAGGAPGRRGRSGDRRAGLATRPRLDGLAAFGAGARARRSIGDRGRGRRLRAPRRPPRSAGWCRRATSWPSAAADRDGRDQGGRAMRRRTGRLMRGSERRVMHRPHHTATGRPVPSTDDPWPRTPPRCSARSASWPTVRPSGAGPSRPRVRASSSSSSRRRLPTAPIELTRVGKWIERVETLRLDGERPTSKALAARLGVVLAAVADGPLHRRVGGSRSAGAWRRSRGPSSATGGRTSGGALAPDAALARRRRGSGGRRPTATEEYEDALLTAFAAGVPTPTWPALPDGRRPAVGQPADGRPASARRPG